MVWETDFDLFLFLLQWHLEFGSVTARVWCRGGRDRKKSTSNLTTVKGGMYLVSSHKSLLSHWTSQQTGIFIVQRGTPNYNGRYAVPIKKKEKKEKKGKADLTTVLHIRELPHLHMKLAFWFSFPTTNNKNPMIPSWSLVSIYNYSFNPDQIFTKIFEKLELEICSKISTCGMIFLQVSSSLPISLKNMC